MRIKELSVCRFRLFRHLSFTPGAGVNVFCGRNASGKTALLEAVYFLSRARSFRTARFSEIVRHGDSALMVSAELLERGLSTRVGIEKDGRLRTLIRSDGKRIGSASELARRVPVLTVLPDSASRLFMEGPGYRRNWLDGFLFHVKPEFLSCWKDYHRALRSRNRLLRDPVGQGMENMVIWEQAMCQRAEGIERLRTAFLTELQEVLGERLGRLYSGTVRMVYRSGWGGSETLAERLRQQRQADRERGYTQSGCHRADVRFYLDDREVCAVLSRGQLKLFGTALVLGQSWQMHRHTGQRPVMLIDDADAELDGPGRDWLMTELRALDAQSFVTTLDPALGCVDGRSTVFHMKQGALWQQD